MKLLRLTCVLTLASCGGSGASSPAPTSTSTPVEATSSAAGRVLGEEFVSLGLPIPGGEFKEYVKDMPDQRTVWFEHDEGEDFTGLANMYRDTIKKHGYEECGEREATSSGGITVQMCGAECAAIEIVTDKGERGMIATIERVDMPCGI